MGLKAIYNKHAQEFMNIFSTRKNSLSSYASTALKMASYFVTLFLPDLKKSFLSSLRGHASCKKESLSDKEEKINNIAVQTILPVNHGMNIHPAELITSIKKTTTPINSTTTPINTTTTPISKKPLSIDPVTQKSVECRLPVLSPIQMNNIQYIVNTLANISLLWLAYERPSLENASRELRSIHPFTFLIFLFTDQSLTKGVNDIKNRTPERIWIRFKTGIINGLEITHARGELDNHLEEFTQKLQLDIEIIREQVKQKRWDQLIDIIMDNSPFKMPNL